MGKEKAKRAIVGKFIVKRLMGYIALIYILMILFAYFFSDRLIFFPQRPGYSDSQEIIKIRTADGAKISAMYFPNADVKFTILYSHGNAEDIGDLRELFETFNRNGFSVFAYDYHGYGTSEGKPSEKNAYRDVEAAYNYLVGELKTPPGRIIALGRSVGGGAATHIAGREKIAGLILESSFITAFRVVTYLPLLPFDKFRNIAKIKNVRCPVLVIHGRADTIIPFRHGEKLFAAANEPKFKLWVDDAGHNDLVPVADGSYWDGIRRFADTINSN